MLLSTMSTLLLRPSAHGFIFGRTEVYILRCNHISRPNGPFILSVDAREGSTPKGGPTILSIHGSFIRGRSILKPSMISPPFVHALSPRKFCISPVCFVCLWSSLIPTKRVVEKDEAMGGGNGKFVVATDQGRSAYEAETL